MSQMDSPIDLADAAAYDDLMRSITEDVLIGVYVPEADQLDHGAALQIALERDEAAARQLAADVIGLVE